MKTKPDLFMSATPFSLIITYTNSVKSIKLFLGVALLLLSAASQAEMYKYITKDGKTVLTGERLKGKGNRLVKVYRLKKSKAYKSSFRKK